jgi:hypothetical protein
MRHFSLATAMTAVLLATGAFLDCAGAADVAPSPPAYPANWLWSTAKAILRKMSLARHLPYDQPRSASSPQLGYVAHDQIGPPPAYDPPRSIYSPPRIPYTSLPDPSAKKYRLKYP